MHAAIVEMCASAYDESLIGFCRRHCTIFACTTDYCSYELEKCNYSNDIRLCNENPTLSYAICGWPAPASMRTFRSIHRVRVSGTAVTRSCFDVSRRDARFNRGRHCVVRVHHRPARLNRGLPAGPYPPRKGCRKAAPSAARGYQVPVPALALLRRTALADRLALGLLKAGFSQDVLRHRSRSLARSDGWGKIRHH